MHTDLATIENMDELGTFKSTVFPYNDNSLVWIGLYSKIEWKWSDGYTGPGADYRNWEIEFASEPDNNGGAEFCVDVSYDGTWWDYYCDELTFFICYRGTLENPEFVYVNTRLNWTDAQSFCRENYVDLATVKSNAENDLIYDLIPNDIHPWIGLYRDPQLHWSDGSNLTFQFWVNAPHQLSSGSVICSTADMFKLGKWKLKSCETKFPFVCYGDSPTEAEEGSNNVSEDSNAPVSVPETMYQRKVIQLKMRPENFSTDLNDPAVKADTLQKLQDRLKESGLSGVTLKWREQPDGKVFHKEAESL
ncbi:secretory phospholipase A2 receptor-like [Xyrichtys novacula]|uniref:Secretory phospholipase A2 receptor-like n=1 Tax=Xyrichtys novacula TaxID=13765 RepID=A0AAV1HNF7_XYRNO|nr:secretory phospholipase A2 receptor-like [Xyrichtys novacula]